MLFAGTAGQTWEVNPDGGFYTVLKGLRHEYLEIPKSKNAQVRPISREVDLAWLAGIIDGEGNIQATIQRKKSGVEGSHLYFQPQLRITNTDVRMIQKISEIYVDERIVFFYRINLVSRYKNKKPTWKDQLEITVGAKNSISKILKMVVPYLINKKKYAEMMLETLQYVDEQPHRGRMSGGSNYVESKEFLDRINAMKEERLKLINPSTTVRKARRVLTW